MNFTLGEHDCSNCAALCCYSLVRNGPGFNHNSSIAGEVCSHIICNQCKIHDTLSDRSPSCVQYSCFGAGQFVTWMSGKDKGEILGEKDQRRFILLQCITNRIKRAEMKLKQGSIELEKLIRIDELVAFWKKIIIAVNIRYADENFWLELDKYVKASAYESSNILYGS